MGSVSLQKSIYHVSYQPISKPRASWKTGVWVCAEHGGLHVMEGFQQVSEVLECSWNRGTQSWSLE